jgi:hypothetical protein
MGKCKVFFKRLEDLFGKNKQMQGHHDARMPVTGPTTAETLSTKAMMRAYAWTPVTNLK